MTRTIGHFRRTIVGSPAYLKKAGIPETPHELSSHSCLIYRFPTTGKLDHWPIHTSDETAPPELTRSVITNTLEPQISLAENGLGLACVPDIAVARQIKAGSLVSVLDAYLPMRTKISIVWPTSRYLSPKLRAFIDFGARELL